MQSLVELENGFYILSLHHVVMSLSHSPPPPLSQGGLLSSCCHLVPSVTTHLLQPHLTSKSDSECIILGQIYQIKTLALLYCALILYERFELSQLSCLGSAVGRAHT